MSSTVRFLLPCLALLLTTSGLAADRPLIIAHRGSSGMRPEHTVEGYQLAVEQGADFIECDLSITSDLVLICLHESWINATTDVASHPEFHDKIRTYTVPGEGRLTDYFAVDFTLDEIRTLGKVQQWPFRDQSYNGMYKIATLEEYVQVAKNTSSRTVWIYPEIKDPKWLNSLPILNNTRIEDIVLEALAKLGYKQRADPIILQSFDEDTLKYVHNKTDLKLLMLSEKSTSDPSYPSDAKLDEWATFAYAVGPSKDQLVSFVPSVHSSQKLTAENSTGLIERIHRRGMKIHAYTFRNEDEFLATNFGQDEYAEYAYFEKLGVDGYFTDFTASMRRYLDYTKTGPPSSGGGSVGLMKGETSLFASVVISSIGLVMGGGFPF